MEDWDEFDEDFKEYAIRDDAKLAWQNYCKYSDIVPDGKTTFFISVGSDEASKQALEKIRLWSKAAFPESHMINDEYGNEFLKIIDKTETVLAFQIDNCVVARFQKGDLREKIIKFLEGEYLDQCEFFVELEHKSEKLWLKNSDLTVYVKTGTIKENPWWLPHTVMKFNRGRKVVAKALIGYNAIEMCETYPTLLMFEVAPELRRKGFGSKIMLGIECYFWNQGFPKLRLDNTKAITFWSKLGYDIDIDEGEKNLGYLEFEEDCNEIISK